MDCIGNNYFPVLIRITVPYGRHTTNTWGPLLNNRLGWLLMEAPVVIVFSWFFFTGNSRKINSCFIFYGLFYASLCESNFYFSIQDENCWKTDALVNCHSCSIFQFHKWFFNGYWFGSLSPVYQLSWLYDPRFIIGVILFFSGMYINISSDNKLVNLRSGGKIGYYIPYGGLFKYISSPNLFGEIIEWIGWAIMGWCLPGFSFAIWTMANLLPRALDHHRWYNRRFSDYPKDRKAIIPKVL